MKKKLCTEFYLIKQDVVKHFLVFFRLVQRQKRNYGTTFCYCPLDLGTGSL